MTFPVGAIVEHPARPAWGPGRVLAVEGTILAVYFRDAVETRAGEAVKRLDTGLVALRPAARQDDPRLAHAWLTADGRAAWTRPRLTLEQALEAFLRRFPGGFADPGYLGDRHAGERAGKLEAHELWTRTLGHGQARRLVRLGSVDLFRAHLLAVEQRLTLLSPVEKTALRDGLREAGAAARVFAALTDVLHAPAPAGETWEPYAEAVASLPAPAGRTPEVAWPIATLLPFIAQPDRHMLLKPGITRQCAEILAFDLRYAPAVRWATYERLLAMSRLLLAHLAPHGARDLIDVQAFMWVVAALAGDGPRPRKRTPGPT
jgi:hypothetical protein